MSPNPHEQTEQVSINPDPQDPATGQPSPVHGNVEEPAVQPPANSPRRGHTITVQGLDAYYADNHAVCNVTLEYAPNSVTAMIGPSGCGKSTVLRCLNRMHEEITGAYATGDIRLDGMNLYAPDVDVVAVRRAIGMVFQKPNPFPTMSIADNVAAGLKLAGIKGKDKEEIVERSLRSAGLWDEVKDRLGQPGISLSGGQQQRLCIARTIATEPNVILMDEPCSALDPIATLKIEDLIHDLKRDYTIIIVTHNMQQAARVADTTSFFLLGELIEVGDTGKIFTNPADSRTEDYISGKFG